MLYPPVAPAAAVPALTALAESADWVLIGLVWSIAGCFLLANAILFRHPRELVAEHFGASRKRLTSIKSYLFHRVQVSIGFLLLLAGFGLQLFGRARDASRPPEMAPGETGFPVEWVGLTVLLIAGLIAGGWWISHRLFQRYVREYLVENDIELESDSKLTREVGELFGMEPAPEDTVQSYAAKVRQRARLPFQSSLVRGNTPTNDLQG